MKALCSLAMASSAFAQTIELDSTMTFGMNSLSEIDTKFIQSVTKNRFFLDLATAF